MQVSRVVKEGETLFDEVQVDCEQAGLELFGLCGPCKCRIRHSVAARRVCSTASHGTQSTIARETSKRPL